MPYNCSICGYFESENLSKVVSHISLQHGMCPNFHVTCGISNCPQTFTKFASYKTHLYRKHRNHFHLDVRSTLSETRELSCPYCKCPVESHKVAVSHLHVHLVEHNEVECPFEVCDVTQRVYSSLRAHVSRHHKNDTNLKQNWKNARNNALVVDDDHGDDTSFMDDEDSRDDEYMKEKYLESLALVLLKLEAVHLVPVSTIQHVVLALIELLNLTGTFTSQSLKRVFEELPLEPETVENLCVTVKKPVFLEAFEKLNSDYLRKDYYRKKISICGTN